MDNLFGIEKFFRNQEKVVHKTASDHKVGIVNLLIKSSEVINGFALDKI